MRQLLLSVKNTPKLGWLFTFTLISMVFLTIASQLEIFALGVITKKGPSLFELFAPLENGALAPQEEISFEELRERWPAIAGKEGGVITSDGAMSYMKRHKGGGVIDSLTNRASSYLSIDKNLYHLALFLAAVALIKATTLFFYRLFTKLIAIAVSKHLRQRYFEHIQKLPMQFYQKHNIGSLSSRVVNDSHMIAESINSCLINYLQTPFTVATTVTLCFLTSWQLSLIMFLGFPLIVFPIFFIARRIKKISKEILNNQEHFLSLLIDFIAGIMTVKVFSMEQFSLKKYIEQNEKLADLEKRSARYDVSSRPIVHTLGMSFLSTALLYGLYVQQMSISEVVFFSGLLYVFYEPIKKFAEENNNIQRGNAAAERMYEILEVSPSGEQSSSSLEIKEFAGKIEFRDVWFKYDRDWVLKGLNLTINKGETVAIVGPTGAGKSTIIQLLPRLYSPSSGTITIDGKNIDSFSLSSLREMIAVVPQKSFLFIDSVASNLSVGRKCTPEMLKEAAKKAHADEFIEKLPGGYQTLLAEAGKDLSGGQQQRLTIARALVKGAPILLMDEATSSLDAVSENHIQSAIRQLRGEVTQVIIAHRLSTIEDADRIVYIDDGTILAEGSKSELLLSCPPFRAMWEMMHRDKRPMEKESEIPL